MNMLIRQAFLFLVLLAVPIASYFLLFAPRNAQVEKAKMEIAHKYAKLEKLRENNARGANLAEENRQLRESIAAIQARLPSGKEMDEVLRQVAIIANKCGLKVPKFQKNDKPMPAGLAMEQPIDVEITGDFDGFYSFLLELEQLPRITRIPELQITRSEKVEGEMQAKFVLSIYYEGEVASNP